VYSPQTHINYNIQYALNNEKWSDYFWNSNNDNIR